MKKMLLLYSLIFLLENHSSNQIKQGLSGCVFLKQGNHTPSPGQKPKQGTPLQTEIFIYELTTRDQTTENGVHYTNIKTKLIAKTSSDKIGKYTIKLPTGHYSVFVNDNSQLFASIYDDRGNINPVEVKANKVTHQDIVITSNAVF